MEKHNGIMSKTFESDWKQSDLVSLAYSYPASYAICHNFKKTSKQNLHNSETT